jgi:hypothetical protein
MFPAEEAAWEAGQAVHCALLQWAAWRTWKSLAEGPKVILGNYLWHIFCMEIGIRALRTCSKGLHTWMFQMTRYDARQAW